MPIRLLMPTAVLYRAVAAIDEDDLAADEVRRRRCQEENQVRDLQRRPESVKWNTRFNGRALLLVGPDPLPHVRKDDGRRNGVRLDVQRTPFGSHDAHQHVEPAL